MNQSLLARELSGEEWVRGDMRRMGFTPPAEEGLVMADPDVESLANEMAASAAGLTVAETAARAVELLQEFIRLGCPRVVDKFGDEDCFYCGEDYHSPHLAGCLYAQARAFLGSLK